MQYYNNPLSWSVWYFFNDAKTTSTAYLVNNMNSGSQLLGKSKIFCPGIFPSVVNNGYFVASLGVFCFYPQFSKNRYLGRIISALLVLTILVTLMMIQQRMAFFLFIIVTCVINYKRHKVATVFTIILAAIAFELVDMQFDESVIGRLADTEDKIRATLYETGIEYVTTHLLVGGRAGYERINEHSAHNIFLNAIMYGGLFGGIVIIAIYFRMCYKAVRIIVLQFNHRRNVSVAFAYSLLTYNLISLTHNSSLLTGDPIIWILYAMMLVAQKYEVAKSKTRIAMDNRLC
ncbi:MAG: O-antigen ligase family protein [Bacteroides sp.]|nr:O-antigen ligase family protein [Bacteroides sp.]